MSQNQNAKVVAVNGVPLDEFDSLAKDEAIMKITEEIENCEKRCKELRMTRKKLKKTKNECPENPEGGEHVFDLVHKQHYHNLVELKCRYCGTETWIQRGGRRRRRTNRRKKTRRRKKRRKTKRRNK
jgi:hypothetical protein